MMEDLGQGATERVKDRDHVEQQKKNKNSLNKIKGFTPLISSHFKRIYEQPASNIVTTNEKILEKESSNLLTNQKRDETGPSVQPENCIIKHQFILKSDPEEADIEF